MQNVIDPFSLKYKGNDADFHVVDALVLGDSIQGAAKLYNSVAHYCFFGGVPKGNYRKHFKCYAQTPKEGSFEFVLYLATIAQEYDIHGEIYKESFSWLFAKIANSLTGLWTNRSTESAMAEKLTDQLIERAKRDAELQALLINGVIGSNNNIADLHGRLIDTLPALANANSNAAKQLVKPVGITCSSLAQFAESDNETVITEAEAEVISSDSALEIEDAKVFQCERVTEVNTLTGHCILQVAGYTHLIKGKISDPVLSNADNIYTRALNNHTPIRVTAKTVLKEGEVHRLYISDAKA